MANVVKVIKLQLPAGAATPAPPVGTILGPTGVNMQQFCSEFNDKTRERSGEIVPLVISIYDDRTFSLEYKISPVSDLLKKASGIKKGSGKPLMEKVGSITRAQIREIAEKKLPDLNTTDIDAAMRTVEGTARQMGLIIKE